MNINLIAGIFFAILSILVIIRNTIVKKRINFFWFCNFSPILFAIGFFISNIQFVKAIISIGLIGQTITLFTILSLRISEKLEKGKITSYSKFYLFVEFLIHITPFIAIILTFNVLPNILSIKYALWIVIFMFIGSYSFTPKKENVNAIYYSEIVFSKRTKKGFKFPFQTQLWIFYGMCNVGISFLIQLGLYHLIS